MRSFYRAGAVKRSSAAAGNNYYVPPGKQQHSQGLSRRSTGLPGTRLGMLRVLLWKHFGCLP